MKFSEYKFERPNIDEIKVEFNQYIDEFNNAQSAKAQGEVIKKINGLREKVETAFSLASTRYSIDTSDKFYEEANDLVDQIAPIYSGLINNYYKALLNSKFKDELAKEWGSNIFKIAEVSLKSFDEKIIEDLQTENKLSSQYTKLLASAKIKFRGKVHTLAQLGKYMRSENRRTRRAASEAYFKFFADNMEKIDKIYDDMVHVRDTMAKKLGYKNFVELGYLRLGRTDYDASMVKNYREQISKDLVPVSQELFARQIKRIGVKNPEYYDYNLQFTSGNATPKGNKDWMIERAKTMYDELSPETSTFFRFMTDRELLDLEAKPHKAGGGYCTYFSAYKSPFIFANFNGTAGDVEVLTHEVGHAFQAYCSRDYKLPEYISPTLEACEIHSMSMEFFTWPWMDKFFLEDVDKFKFSHLSGAITFIPYGVSVDEFQHFVYENPDATPEQRRLKWREIERKYLPHLEYENNEFLQNGGYWMRQGHIFSVPFYYIDYTLAQVIAFQFFNEMHVDRKAAWEKYVTLCKLGGSQSFVSLLKECDLNLPFNDGTVKKAVEPLSAFLNSIDDTKL
jgi:M3 family oligoendopeptidase